MTQKNDTTSGCDGCDKYEVCHLISASTWVSTKFKLESFVKPQKKLNAGAKLVFLLANKKKKEKNKTKAHSFMKL